MPNSLICVDANLVVRRFVAPANTTVQRLWDRWDEEGQPLAAPTLLRYEITNAFYQLARHGGLTPAVARQGLEAALALPITLHADEDLHREAFTLAVRLTLPATHDAHYLALAERLGVELWTADQRLANTVRHQLAWVHLVG